jgi:hypothetical protein
MLREFLEKGKYTFNIEAVLEHDMTNMNFGQDE